MTTTASIASPKGRLISLDALRGFDMFWIIGARSLAVGLVALKLPGMAALTGQLYHSEWNGFTFYDLIFPLFIFITGVSLFLSIRKRLQRGDGRRTIIKHVMKRAVILFLLGILYNSGFNLQSLFSSVRVMGVLQRSAICYLVASLLLLYTRPRTQAVTVIGILAGYWAIMRFVPVPGYGAGVWTEQGNLARYIDSLLLPGRFFYGSWDPEGLLSTIPSVATCLLGVLTGWWLQVTEWRNELLDPKRRALYLFMAGLVLAVSGVILDDVFPINKNLWTSSYVLLTGGLSVLLLTAFHWVIDLCGHKSWSFPFIVIGMNSLFIYLAARVIPFNQIVNWLIGGDFFSFLGRSQSLVASLAQLTLEGLLLFYLYNRRTFIRI